MKKIIILFAILFLNLPLAGQTKDKWIEIATKTVSFTSDKDVVNPNQSEKRVDKIKIKCLEGTLKLKRIKVEMSDGTKKEYDAKGVGVLTKGMSSFSFDLPGKGLKLNKIELYYDSVGNVLISKRAKIVVLGKIQTN